MHALTDCGKPGPPSQRPLPAGTGSTLALPPEISGFGRDVARPGRASRVLEGGSGRWSGGCQGSDPPDIQCEADQIPLSLHVVEPPKVATTKAERLLDPSMRRPQQSLAPRIARPARRRRQLPLHPMGRRPERRIDPRRPLPLATRRHIPAISRPSNAARFASLHRAASARPPVATAA